MKECHVWVNWLSVLGSNKSKVFFSKMQFLDKAYWFKDSPKNDKRMYLMYKWICAWSGYNSFPAFLPILIGTKHARDMAWTASTIHICITPNDNMSTAMVLFKLAKCHMVDSLQSSSFFRHQKSVASFVPLLKALKSFFKKLTCITGRSSVNECVTAYNRTQNGLKEKIIMNDHRSDAMIKQTLLS